jgi:type III restriction enzyme
LDDLQDAARTVQNNENRYIRPILLVRVERTGKDQRDKHAIHAEDVREFLIEKLGASADEIKVKSSEMDELADVEKQPEYKGNGLLSDLCPVRYVITKDALREGWDCPFAYILAALSRTTAATAITQMVGRVLRQPGAEWTGMDALNECYVYTHDADVQQAVENVRKGLQEEGMGDLADGVRVAGSSQAGSRRTRIQRRDAFKGLRIFMPRVLSKHYRIGDWRRFDYERDLLPRLDWQSFSFRGADRFVADDRERIDVDVAGRIRRVRDAHERNRLEAAPADVMRSVLLAHFS